MNRPIALTAFCVALLSGVCAYGLRAQDLAARTDGLAAQQGLSGAGVFDRWLNAEAPECVPVSEIASVSRLTRLNAEQFEFVRALYVAIPPISRSLPPGDSAVVASADGKAMIALVQAGETCARFLAPDFILTMLAQVGKGEVGLIGEPI